MKRTPTAKAGLNIRMKEALRAKIEKAAKARDVSMNAEMVERLEKSFERDSRTQEDHEIAYRQLMATYGPRATGLALLMMEAMNRTAIQAERQAARAASRHAKTPKDELTAFRAERDGWVIDPYAYSQAEQAAVRVLEAIRPRGDVKIPDNTAPGATRADVRLSAQILGSLGLLYADQTIRQTLEPGHEPWSWSETTYRLLGELRDLLSSRIKAREIV